MPQISCCRLLRHAPAPGVWNMAVDEMLLDRAAKQAAPCLRMYAWNEPTLSLGYFQTYADRLQHGPSRHCAAVRRLTGGGAILHNNEITYSIVLPGNHPLAMCRDELYRSLHVCLIEALASLGIVARLCGDPLKAAAAPEPFLCFQRRSPGDVLLGEHKICGSAQRRRNEAVLQHGSLLWRGSAAAPELPGVADLIDSQISQEAFWESWFDGLRRRLAFEWENDDLEDSEVREARSLVEARYVGEHWTKHRRRGIEAAGW